MTDVLTTRPPHPPPPPAPVEPNVSFFFSNVGLLTLYDVRNSYTRGENVYRSDKRDKENQNINMLIKPKEENYLCVNKIPSACTQSYFIQLYVEGMLNISHNAPGEPHFKEVRDPASRDHQRWRETSRYGAHTHERRGGGGGHERHHPEPLSNPVKLNFVPFVFA